VGEAEGRQPDGEPEGERSAGFVGRTRERLAAGARWATQASERHISVAVPFRAAERDRRVAASVLAGGVAYRIFLWLLPFGLILGGALGLGDADGIEDALEAGGVPAGVVDAIGNVARASDSSSLLLLAIGVPLLLWAGYTGAKALQLIHALVWNEPPPRTPPLESSLVFTGMCCAFMVAVGVTWWLRDSGWLTGLAVAAVAIVPLAGLWLWTSLLLPHGNASWKALLPGAFLVAAGFQILHGLMVNFLIPKLERSTSHYGVLGITATLLFFMYLAGRLVVMSPVLNSSLHEELRKDGFPRAEDEPGSPSGASPV
jgi:uncharacterized BrkB/YihY/UPF0761 family membrane protein